MKKGSKIRLRIAAGTPGLALMERAGGDWVAFEQLDDVISLRRFRQSVFRRADAPDDPRTWREGLAGLYAMGQFERVYIDEQGVVTYRSALGETFRTNDAALHHLLDRLNAAFPDAVPLAGLADTPGLPERILSLYTSTLIGLQTTPSPFTLRPGPKPLASPLARRQAAAGQQEVASLRHLPIKLEDEDARRFLLLVDGERDRAELARALMAQDPALTADAAAAQVERGLDGMGRMGLLVR